MADFSKITVGSSTYNVKDATARAAISALQASAGAAQDSGNLAPAFVTTKSYGLGEYVTYAGVLYRCTTLHSAGAWVASHFTQVKIGDEIYIPGDSIEAVARGTILSSYGITSIRLDSDCTFPAGLHVGRLAITSIDFLQIADGADYGVFDFTAKPFKAFNLPYSIECPYSWFRTGTPWVSKDLIYIDEPITVVSGTEIGTIENIPISGECEFTFRFCFTRLSTH